MRMKFFIFGLTIFVAFALALIVESCNKDNFSKNTDEQLSMRNSKISQQQIYDMRKAFAKTLLLAMQDEPALRTYIKSKCQVADTSQFELLYVSIKDNIVTRGLTFSQILKSHAPEDVIRNFGQDFFNSLVNDIPLLMISFPDLYTIKLIDWTTNTVPDVAAVSKINPKFCTFFTLENTTGIELELNDNQMEEDIIKRPVLAVYDAETHYLINDEGKTFDGVHIDSIMPRGGGDPPPGSIHDCWHYYLESQQAIESYVLTQDGRLQQYYLVEHNKLLEKYMECLNLFGVTQFTTDLDNPCQRDHEILDEHVVDFRINGLNVLKNIHNQWFERKYIFHGDVMALTRNSFGEVGTFNYKLVTEAYSRFDLLDCPTQVLGLGVWQQYPFITLCNGTWKTINYRWYTDWKQDQIGSPFQVKWAEVDGGSSTISFKLGLNAKFKDGDNETTGFGEVGYSYTGSQIVELGNAPVFYCDPLMMENNTTSVTFRCD